MGEEPEFVRFLLVENVPFHTTAPDLSFLFRDLGAVLTAHPFRFATYDLNAALLEFRDCIPPDAVRQLKTARFR
jgi:hypothetical protein